MIKELKRSTIFVKNLERSLQFYRDILGFSVIADHVIEGPEVSKLLGIPNVKVRIFMLQVGKQKTAQLGLLSFLSPIKEKSHSKSQLTPAHALIFDCEDVEEIFKRMLESGEKPISKPVILGGSVKTFACLDPDGIYVEFGQILHK